MPYTTLTQVEQMFPTFTPNSAKGPSDTLIQTFIDDVAGEINAVLQRRFQEAYQVVGFEAWAAAFTADQLNLLERINRAGACVQVLEVFASLGIKQYQDMSEGYAKRYTQMLNHLNARDDAGKPVPEGGEYDYLFDSQAKVETPRPQLGGVAGGDQYPGENDGTSSVFKKWDRREF